MNKQRKIAIFLHSMNGILFIAFSFILFVISHTFTAFDAVQDPSLYIYALLFFFGIPFVIALLPIIALVKFGKTARKFLWIYSIVIAVLFFPVGSAIGGHTIYLLRTTENSIFK